MYRRSLEGSSGEAVKDLGHEAADSAKGVAHKAEDAVQQKSA